MDVDCYRLAYNTFYQNWQRFGIPEKDIPFPKTEVAYPLNVIIPGFSKAVVFFQITSRSDLKTFFYECPRVHNLSDFCTRFELVMKKVFPERFIIEDLPKESTEESPKYTVAEVLTEGAKMEGLSEVAMQDDKSEDTMETYLSEDTAEDELSEDSKKESLSKDSKIESLPEDSEKDENKIKSEEVPALIAFSLAVCTELILYQYDDNKKYMKYLPDMWIKYFNENLKGLCEEAGCTSDNLKTYSESIRCPEKFLNKFVTENKNEYLHIEDKFRDYIKTNYAVESPDHGKFIIEVRNFPKRLSFAKMKTQFRAFVESCRCVKGISAEKVPLLDDYSPSSPTSP